jgi:hypothetical protein
MIMYCGYCHKELLRRRPSALNKNGHNFCNHHCSASFTNSFRITQLTLAKRKRMLEKPTCANPGCYKQIGLENKIYCSPECRFIDENEKSKDYVLQEIQKFVKKFDRVPIKYELPTLSSRSRHCFGTWNKAVKAAGFIPNKVVFSKRYTANDGHKCDSLSEKIVDDWLSARNIKHEIHVRYPWGNGMSADFKVGDCWIELFGLSGQFKNYDRLMAQKLELVKQYNLKLVSLYLSDIFPSNNLNAKLSNIKSQIVTKKARR